MYNYSEEVSLNFFARSNTDYDVIEVQCTFEFFLHVFKHVLSLSLMNIQECDVTVLTLDI